MKIALLSEKYTPDLGGLAISVGRLGHLLASAGHDVRVFAPTLNLSPSENRTLIYEGVSVKRFGAHKRGDDTLVDWFELLVDEHKHEPFDLLHAYFLPQAGFIAAYAGNYLNIPSVVSIRGNDVERAAFDPSKFSHVMYAMQNTNALTTNTRELAKKARAFFDRKVTLIPNGIDVGSFKATSRNGSLAVALGLREGKNKEDRSPVIGFAGELREKKGLRTLNGYAQINKKMAFTLLIVGEIRPGEDKAIFDEMKSAIPNSNIIVSGSISHQEMPAYYSLMDVFVHPSLRDGMPNALLEAMACEKAVIATPVGGMLDVIKDGENGIFVPVNDADSFAAAIQDLMANKLLRETLGQKARQTILNGYTPDKELELNLTEYHNLIGK